MAFQFESEAIRFAMQLFTKSFNEENNALISPLSVSLALGMVMRGAEGETKEEMRKVLAGELDQETFENALTEYAKSLPSNDKTKFHFADSIWVEKAFKLHRKYEKKTEKLYKSVIERLPFDEEAVRKINAWVAKETDGMIDSVVDSVTPEAMLYLINALAFDGEWAEIYSQADVRDHSFRILSGEEVEIKGMWHDESIYLKGEGCTGFVKPYAGTRYSFVALLPDEEKETAEFIRGLTAEKYAKILSSRSIMKVSTMLPKFTLDYSDVLNGKLSDLGMARAFGPGADFSGMSPSPIAIGEVIHKTHIEVDERGTKAGAVTAVMMKMMAMPEPKPEVILDRPFVYAIVDNEHFIPLFIGALMRP